MAKRKEAVISEEHLKEHMAKLNLARINYTKAIDYYNNQKENFVKIYNAVRHTKIDDSNFLQEIFGEKIDFVTKEQIEKQSKMLYEDMFYIIKDKIENMMANTSSFKQKKGVLKSAASKYNSIHNKYNKNKTEDLKKMDDSARTEYQKILDSIWSKEEFQETVLNKAASLGIIPSEEQRNKKDFNFNNIPSGLYTLRNAMFRNYLIGKEELNTLNTKNAQPWNKTKGYIGEYRTYDLFDSALSQFSEDFSFEILHSGQKNKASDADIKIKLNVPKDIIVQTGIIMPEQIYGIQSKSWELTSQKIQNGQITLSTNENLYNKVKSQIKQNSHKWCCMILSLSSLENMITATDKSFIWRTGRGFIWTSDLIQKIMDMDAFIGFEWVYDNNMYGMAKSHQLLVEYLTTKSKN